MKRYSNSASGVKAYEIGLNYILVKFQRLEHIK